MSLKTMGGLAALVLAFSGPAVWAQAPTAELASGCPCANAPTDCATGCCAPGGCPTCGGILSHCCPKYVLTIEKAPKICFKCVCPKPQCDMCDIAGYGYYPTCWRPFAYPPNYEHCPVPPPGALASQSPPLIVTTPGPAGPAGPVDETLPAPKKAANPNPDR